MPGSAVVEQDMTAQVGSALHKPPRRWGPAVLLGALLLSSCGKEVDQELDLRFNDPSKSYGIQLADENGGVGPTHKINPGSREVLVRVSGGKVSAIIVVIYEGEVAVCRVKVEVEAEGPTEVKVSCPPAPPPPPLQPDAGAPEDALPPADAGADVTPDTGPSPACQSYCRDMLQLCTPTYPSADDCLATCTAFGWKEGQRGSAENSSECRRGRAIDTAGTALALLGCYQAGPSGGSFCGTNMCRIYCETAQRACPELLGGGSVDQCVASLCKAKPAQPAYRTGTGDTLDCRIFWLGEVLKTRETRLCARLAEETQEPLCHD
jgi:hypothetical protein